MVFKIFQEFLTSSMEITYFFFMKQIITMIVQLEKVLNERYKKFKKKKRK